jgi:H+/gluconate symporter-like permease
VNFDTVKTVGLWLIIAIGVVGILLAIIVKKVIGKIISLVLAAVLVVVLWQQRTKVIDQANDLRSGACSTVAPGNKITFFGISVTLPADWCKK